MLDRFSLFNSTHPRGRYMGVARRYTWRVTKESCVFQSYQSIVEAYAGTNLGTGTRGKIYARGNMPLVIADGRDRSSTYID